MGQNQSYPDGSIVCNPGECGGENSGSGGAVGNPISGSSEDAATPSSSSSLHDPVDKRIGAISQAQSVRAAIDTLIESCLVAKDDGLNGETVKGPSVGYSLEQLNSLKHESGETTESASATKEKKEKKTIDGDVAKVTKTSLSASTPKTFGLFMENSIIELITKGEEEQDRMLSNQKHGESATEESVKHIGSVGDSKNPCDQNSSSPGDKDTAVCKTDDVKTNSMSKTLKIEPKRTVRLQTLIDTVLDNSLANEMPSAYEKRKNYALVNDLLVNKSDSSSRNVNRTKPPVAKATKPASEVPENKMVFLMDHIDRVLQKNLQASYEDPEEDGNMLILSQLSRESPSSTSTSIPNQTTESSPKTKPNNNQSRASSGSNSCESTISVQDIVDRVISQTEVISKLLSPSDHPPAAAPPTRTGRELSSKNSPAVSNSSQQISSQPSSKTDPEQRSPQNRPSSGSHLLDGHSLKMSDYSPRGRPRAATYDSHQLSTVRHAQDSRSAVGHSSAAEYRQMDAISSNEGMHGMSKNSKTVAMSSSFGTPPLLMAPYANSLAPTSGIMSYAQSPVFRPPANQMFVPRYPVPLLRVDVPSDSPQGLPPHPPSKSCACVSCVSKFHMEEHSPKHGILGPVSPSSGMRSPHGQMDSNYYQQRLANQLHPSGQHNPFVMRDYNRPGPNSPGRYPVPSAAQMAAITNKQGMGQAQKTVHYPPPVHPGGYSRDTEFHGYTNYEKQKLEMLKSERNYQSPHLQQVLVQNPFDAPPHPPTEMMYSNVDPGFHAGRLEPNPQRTEEQVRAVKYESVDEKRLYSLPSRTSPAQVAGHVDARRDREHVQSPILDLSVKKVDYVRSPAEDTPSRSQAAVESSDQPLDLSKKTSVPASFPNDHMKRPEFRSQKNNEPVGFRKPDGGVKQDMNSKPHQPQMDNAGRYYHSQQRDVHPSYSSASPMFNMNARVPGPAEMAPTVNPNMLVSASGQRPQLHPLPAPSLATSSSSMLQASMAHAHPSSLLNQQTVPPAETRDKLNSSGPSPRIADSSMKSQKESPDYSEKGDSMAKRNTIGRNESIQSIIGNHNPNDILYLICRICRQSNGSPYAFRKHFRNHHGFEPKAEHTIVQTISATKSARQNPYASNGPGGECVQFAGSDPVQNIDEPSPGDRIQQSLKKESHGAAETLHLESSAHNDVANKPRKSYVKNPDGKSLGGAIENREDTKYLECPECKQMFQLNDFGSYKRHCRQHNQSRVSGSFIAPELRVSESPDSVDKMQGGITMCKICGVPFSVQYINDHIKAVHGHFCSQCPDVFKSPDELQNHIRSYHSNHFLPATSSGMQISPRQRSPSRCSLPSNSPCLSNSPHHRSPSRSGIPVSTPSPGNVSQKSDREMQSSSPGELVVNVPPSSKPSPTAPSRRTSVSAESTSCGPISSTCEVERMPADNLTISASPDSSSDNVNKCSTPSVSVLSDITVSCSLTSRDTVEDRNNVSSMKSKSKGDDDMDSTVSGSPSSDMVIDISGVDGDIKTQNFFYKHKKFGGHRKRTESCDGSEVSAKVAKHAKNECASTQNVSEDSSSSSGSSSSYKGNEHDKTDDVAVTKDKTAAAAVVVAAASIKPKVDNKVKQEARHQLPFVWDRVTRIQAGKNIKPPDYMT